MREKRQRARKTERLYECVSEKKREGKGIKGTECGCVRKLKK